MLALVDSAICSIPPSPHHHLLDLVGDGGGCRSGRRAVRQGSRAAQGAEERSQREREGRSRGGKQSSGETRRNEWRSTSGRGAALEGLG